MKKDYYFVYKTTNKVNGKYYIGVHHSRSLKDEYLGSGRELRRAVAKYGKKNFIREILELCETKDEAYDAEARRVTWKEVLDPNCYNIKLGGKGGSNGLVFLHLGDVTIRVRDVDVEKYLQQGYSRGRSSKSLEKRRSGQYVYRDGKTIVVPKDQVANFEKNGWIKGRAYLKNRIQVWKENKRIYISPEDLEIYLKAGWKKEMPELWRNRVKKARKVKGPTTLGRIRITNGNVDKLVRSEEVEQFLQTGWRLGGKSRRSAGSKWISKGTESMQVQVSELEKYLQQGWTPGRKNYVRK